MSWFLQKKFENRLGGFLVDNFFKLNLYDFFVEDILGFNENFFKKVLLYSDLKGDEKVLDIGCGTGSFSIYLKQHMKNIELYSTDGSEKMVEIAKRKSKKKSIDINYKTTLAETLPFDDNSFDTIYSIFLLSYVPKMIKPFVLKEIYRVLKPGGKFFLIDIEQQNGLKKGWNFLKYISHPLFIEEALENGYLDMLVLNGFKDVIHYSGWSQWIDIPFIVSKK